MEDVKTDGEIRKTFFLTCYFDERAQSVSGVSVVGDLSSSSDLRSPVQLQDRDQNRSCTSLINVLFYRLLGGSDAKYCGSRLFLN